MANQQDGLGRRRETASGLLRVGIRPETVDGPDTGARMEGGREELRRLASPYEAGVPHLPHHHTALDEAASDRLDAPSAARGERSLGVDRTPRRVAVSDEAARKGRDHGPITRRASPLQGAGGEPANQVALEEGEEDGDGDGREDDAGGELASLDLVLADHEQQPRRQGPHLRLRGEGDGEEELAPRGGSITCPPFVAPVWAESQVLPWTQSVTEPRDPGQCALHRPGRARRIDTGAGAVLSRGTRRDDSPPRGAASPRARGQGERRCELSGGGSPPSAR